MEADMNKPVLTDRTTPRTSDPRLGRAAGALGVVLLLLVVFTIDGGPMFTDASNAEIVRWVHGHETSLYVSGYLEGLAMLLNAAFLGALIWRARVGGTIVAAAYGLIGASVAIDMVNVGAQYALGKGVDRDLGDGAVLGLFSFAEQLTFTDGVTWGLVIAVASIASLRARTLPRPICWLGLVVAGLHLVGIPLQLAWTGTAEGGMGPISTTALLLWWLATSLTLLIRPGRAATIGDTTVGDGTAALAD
jgi:hypothetical protein